MTISTFKSVIDRMIVGARELSVFFVLTGLIAEAFLSFAVPCNGLNTVESDT